MHLVYSSILKEFDTKDVLRDWPPNATSWDLSTQLNVKLQILLRQTEIFSMSHFTEPGHILHTLAVCKELGLNKRISLLPASSFSICVAMIGLQLWGNTESFLFNKFWVILKKPIPPSPKQHSLHSFRNIFVNNTRNWKYLSGLIGWDRTYSVVALTFSPYILIISSWILPCLFDGVLGLLRVEKVL